MRGSGVSLGKISKMLRIRPRNVLETNNNTNGVSHHLHCNLLHGSWESSTEHGLLDIGMGTGCHNLLRLQQEFGIQETVGFIEYQMTNTEQEFIIPCCRASDDNSLSQIKSICL